MSRLPSDRFPYVYVPDTEYVALPGEKQRPVCLVASGFNKGRRVELFFDQPHPCPFPDLTNTLFLGYNLTRSENQALQHLLLNLRRFRPFAIGEIDEA